MMTRKEQVSALACALFNKRTDIDECIAIANKYIQEAEARAQAECAADTRRLEWLGDQCVHVYAPSQCAGGIGCGVCLATHKPEIDRNLRKAIDAAMEGGK